MTAFCVVIAAISIGTTVWIAVTSTSSSIRDRYTQNLASIADVYTGLSGYAATHHSWNGVGAIAADLARRDHTRVVLTSQAGRVIFDSRRGSVPFTTTSPPAAQIDPLQPDTSIGSIPVTAGIDARAVGPFALSRAERGAIADQVRAARACYKAKVGVDAPAATIYPNGRAYLPPGLFAGLSCPRIRAATPGERAAGQALVRAIAPCVARTGGVTPSGELVVKVVSPRAVSDPAAAGPRVYEVTPQASGFQGQLADFLAAVDGSALDCVNDARGAFLAPYVAPPAQLYLSAASALSTPGLSSAGLRNAVLAGVLILLVTVLLAFVAATTLRRPLARLTLAVQETANGVRTDPVPLAGTSEMRGLAAAVNDLSAQLAEADQRRKDMISDVAHELRTPLANIRGWMEAIHDKVVEPDPALTDRLMREAVLLQDLVNDLQDLALADAGQLAVHPETVDIAECIEQVVAAASATTSVPVTVDVTGDTVIEADPTRLRQILSNLLSNAIRATMRGAVHVRATRTLDDVLIEVSDTGHGISESDLTHLFDRFWRADKSRNRAQGGSGLGLAITQSLVAAHRGTIEVRSRLGQGTTITVRLPGGPAADTPTR